MICGTTQYIGCITADTLSQVYTTAGQALSVFLGFLRCLFGNFVAVVISCRLHGVKLSFAD